MSVSYVVLCSAACCTTKLCGVVPHGGWRCFFFLCFQRFPYFHSILIFYIAPLGSTVALTASSCIPVRLQSLRACAEPPAVVSPQRRSDPCIYKDLQQLRFNGSHPSSPFLRDSRDRLFCVRRCVGVHVAVGIAISNNWYQERYNRIDFDNVVGAAPDDDNSRFFSSFKKGRAATDTQYHSNLEHFAFTATINHTSWSTSWFIERPVLFFHKFVLWCSHKSI